MTTLADFKRRLVPGLAVTVEFPGSLIYGNTAITPIPGRTVKRRVHSVTAGKVVWESETQAGKAGSTLHWPRAECITFAGESVAVSHEPGGKPFAIYRFEA